MTDKQAKTFTKLWHELKATHPDAILLFRCGDFYEAYDVDAQACAKILGIELNNCDAGCVMTGFPHYALDTYLPKLIRAKMRVAICDQLVDPKVVNKQESINPKNESIMANVNVKAADLIGKKIVIKNTANYYVVTAVEGDVVKTEFHMGDQEPKPVPLNVRTLENFFASGVWTIEGEKSATDATEDIPEVEDIQPTKPEPKVEEPKAEKPKAAPKPKAEKPKAEPKPKADAPKGGKYTYETYTTSKGKTGAKILGVSETDAVYQQAAAIHASGSYTKDADGNKHFYLCFGPRYTKAAESICKVLNSTKSEEQKLEECKLIVAQATEERAQQREEYKAKREERKAAAESEKTYTAKEVEQVVRKAFGALADAMKEDVAQFEPIIKAALPQAA